MATERTYYEILGIERGATDADIKRLAAHLGLTVKQFRADFIKTDSEEGNAVEFNSLPCPFLQDNRCTVYDCRPRD